MEIKENPEEEESLLLEWYSTAGDTLPSYEDELAQMLNEWLQERYLEMSEVLELFDRAGDEPSFDQMQNVLLSVYNALRAYDETTDLDFESPAVIDELIVSLRNINLETNEDVLHRTYTWVKKLLKDNILL